MKKRILLVSLLTLLFLSLVPVGSGLYADGTWFTTGTPGGGSYNNITSSAYTWQEFHSESAWNVFTTELKIYVNPASGTPGTLSWWIYDVDGSYHPDTLLASGTAGTSGLTPSTDQWMTIDLPESLYLYTETDYIILLQVAGDNLKWVYGYDTAPQVYTSHGSNSIIGDCGALPELPTAYIALGMSINGVLHRLADVATMDATDIYSTKATAGGLVTSLGTDDSLTCSIDYGTTTAYGSNEEYGEVDQAGLYGYYSVNLTDLDPNTTYHYRAKAVGTDCGTIYGDDMTFTTLGATGQATFEIGEMPGTIRSTSVTLYANVNDAGGETYILTMIYADNVSDLTADPSSSMFLIGSSGHYEFYISGLDPAQTYYFDLMYSGSDEVNHYFDDRAGNYYFITNSVDDTTTPIWPTVTVAEYCQCASIGYEDYETANGVGATLIGELTKTGDTVPVSCYFQYGLYDEDSWTYSGTTNPPTALNNTGQFTFNLEGLEPSTRYHFRAVCAGHGMSYGLDINFWTEAGDEPTDPLIPENPISPRVATLTTVTTGVTSATVYGNLIYMGSADIVSLGFEWGTNENVANDHYWYSYTPVEGQFSGVIRNLEPDTTYYYRAIAQGDVTPGDPSYAQGTTYSFTTLPEPTTTTSAGGGEQGESDIPGGYSIPSSWDTTAGHWTILLGAFLLFVIAGIYLISKREKVMGLIVIGVGAFLVIGVGLFIKWVSPWLLVFLAIPIGLLVWQILKGR